jgi:glycerol-3-phosphate dehydrogenase
VETAGVLKNLISLQAGYVAMQDDTSSIDTLVAQATQQIKNHADQLHLNPSTFDQTYCRDHPVYGDMRTSCYGGTRNFMLGQLWKKK